MCFSGKVAISYRQCPRNDTEPKGLLQQVDWTLGICQPYEDGLALIGFACQISAPLDLVHPGAWMWYTPINLDCELWVFHSLRSLSSTRKVVTRTSANQLVHQRVGYSTITTLVFALTECFGQRYFVSLSRILEHRRQFKVRQEASAPMNGISQTGIHQ